MYYETEYDTRNPWTPKDFDNAYKLFSYSLDFIKALGETIKGDSEIKMLYTHECEQYTDYNTLIEYATMFKYKDFFLDVGFNIGDKSICYPSYNGISWARILDKGSMFIEDGNGFKTHCIDNDWKTYLTRIFDNFKRFVDRLKED